MVSRPFACRVALALLGVTLLTACGGGTATPTVTAPPAAPVTPAVAKTILPQIDPSHIRTGSAIIPSPIGQTASGSAVAPSNTQQLPAAAIPATVPVPTATTGMVLRPLTNGQTFTTADKKASVSYPADWEAQTSATAAQFTPKGVSPTDPNATRVTFNGLPVQLDLLTSDNAAFYLQTLAAQTTGRGATDLKVRSIDNVTLGGPGGLPAIRFVVAYTAGVAVVSEQVAVQPPGSDTTWFVSATAPNADFDTKWRPIIDGIAGSVMFP